MPIVGRYDVRQHIFEVTTGCINDLPPGWDLEPLVLHIVACAVQVRRSLGQHGEGALPHLNQVDRWYVHAWHRNFHRHVLDPEHDVDLRIMQHRVVREDLRAKLVPIQTVIQMDTLGFVSLCGAGQDRYLPVIQSELRGQGLACLLPRMHTATAAVDERTRPASWEYHAPGLRHGFLRSAELFGRRACARACDPSHHSPRCGIRCQVRTVWHRKRPPNHLELVRRLPRASNVLPNVALRGPQPNPVAIRIHVEDVEIADGHPHATDDVMQGLVLRAPNGNLAAAISVFGRKLELDPVWPRRVLVRREVLELFLSIRSDFRHLCE
mmetsp:Transcript_129290/g.374372  ORF Transcript_129290/g.374372 Transcript_129290/m.374372 type:complete len:324 (+) Transcript_129290:614-1585(+)